jgi:hypothetical protein
MKRSDPPLVDVRSSRNNWETQAARRTLRAGNAETAEDIILRLLLANTAPALAQASHVRASADLLDHDYLAYWVDELELQDRWRSLP